MSNASQCCVLVLLALLLTGCRPDLSSLPIPPAIMLAILKYFTDERKRFKLRQRRLNPNNPANLQDTIDHHKGFFIQARAHILGALNNDWINEPNQVRMRNRLEADLDKVEAYVAAKLGTAKSPGPLGGPTEPGSPAALPPSEEYRAAGDKHLDLADVSFTRTNTSAGEARQRRTTLVTERVRRVHGIVWRAAGLHPELWEDAGNLKTRELDEVLDRRLRSVERMATQVSSRPALGGGTIKAPAGTPQGPWLDKFRVRPFEYPRLSDNLQEVIAAIGPTNVLPAGSPRFQGDKPWLQDSPARRLLYNVPPYPGLYLEPSSLRQHWRPDGYGLVLQPAGGTTPAQVIDLLFHGRFDWWKRSWMFCDHVLSALNIEALLFGLRRRNSNDREFNDMFEEDYVRLDALVRAGDIDVLMADQGEDPYFDNFPIDERVLEIGDQVIFWNSFLYAYLIRNEWRLENALVMDLESDGNEGRVVRRAVKLQGHGIAAKRYDDYQQHLTVELNDLFAGVRREAATKPASVTRFTWDATGAQIVRWDPFGRFSAPGAWWIGLRLGSGSGAPGHWRSGADVQTDVVRAVIESDVVGDPVNEYPDEFAALFPLYEPRVSVSAGVASPWHQYLRSGGTSAPKRLSPVKATASEIPGFYLGGIGKPIDAVRTKVRT